MEAVGGKWSRRAGYSLKMVGPSQLMWAYSQIIRVRALRRDGQCCIPAARAAAPEVSVASQAGPGAELSGSNNLRRRDD